LKDLYRSISKTFRHVRRRFRLAISKAFVQLLGGEIWLESQEGIGSAFYFSLPLAVKIKRKKSQTNRIQKHERKLLK
jgi:light-regulated signal transduction histidine kinase (bacteriophytochrome)